MMEESTENDRGDEVGMPDDAFSPAEEKDATVFENAADDTVPSSEGGDAPESVGEDDTLPEPAQDKEEEGLAGNGDAAAETAGSPAGAISGDDEDSEDGNPAESGADGSEEDDADSDPDGEGDAGEEDDTGEAPFPLPSVVEAVLFAAREPLKIAHIARAVGKRTRHDAVRQAINDLNVQYLETSRSFEIAEISGRYQLMSRPEFARHIMRIYPKRELAEKEKSHRLTPTALDTLAIIAYKQPVTRGDIEHIRGVACGSVLKTLVERGTIRVVGKRTDLVGQPRVYGTTEAFLAEFGLGSLDELPLRNDFLGILGDEQGAVELFPDADAGDAEQPDASDDTVGGEPETRPAEAEEAAEKPPENPGEHTEENDSEELSEHETDTEEETA